MVFLQEVVGENRRKANSVSNWVSEGQFEFLADKAWPHHAYGKNAIYNHGHHGNAILSRYPLHETKNSDLSMIPYSQRGVLSAKTLGKLHLFCIHFGLFSAERKSQLKKLVSIIHKQVGDTEPLIIAGDFNDWRNSLSKILKHELNLNEALSTAYGKPQRTFPATNPLFPMDRIYYRGLKLKKASVLSGEPWANLSDHCAVYAEFYGV